MKSLQASEGVTWDPVAVLRVGVLTAEGQRALAAQWYVGGDTALPPRLWAISEEGPIAAQVEDLVGACSDHLHNLLVQKFAYQMLLF